MNQNETKKLTVELTVEELSVLQDLIHSRIGYIHQAGYKGANRLKALSEKLAAQLPGDPA